MDDPSGSAELAALPSAPTSDSRQRRRRRERSAAPAPVASKTDATVEPPVRQPPPEPSHEVSERQWRELSGAGHSHLSAGAALRVRDANRLTVADLAEAERGMVLQRRQWTPPQ